MNAKMESIEKNVVKLEIEVGVEKFEEGLGKSYKKNCKDFVVSGFRKGKVPRNVVERYYGEEVLFEDAVGFVYPDAYDDAVLQNELEPVEYPKIEIVQIGKGKNLIFSATVTIKPEIELGPYKGVEIDKEEVVVSDEQIDSEIEKEQSANARITNVEDRATKSGDVCLIDYEGFIDEVPFDGGKGNDYPLTLGSNSFIPGFEEQLLEKEIGQDLDVNVSFPDDYHEPKLAGKQVYFKVMIKGIKEKLLPEINNDFAKEISEFDTIEEYKNAIHEKLLKKASEDTKDNMEKALLDKVVKGSTVEIPRVMVENRLDSIIKGFDENLRAQKLNLKTYLEMTGGDYPGFRKRFEERAEDEVKTALVVGKIGKVENVDVLEEDIDNNIREMAEEYKDTYENLKQLIEKNGAESLIDGLMFKKTIKLLVDNAIYV